MSAVLEPYSDFLQKHVGPVVHDMAQKCGHVFKSITFTVSDSLHPEMWVNPTNAEISVSKGMIDALQDGKFTHVSPELRATLAHEICGHVGHHNNLAIWAKSTVMAGPLVAIAAYELLRHYHKPDQSKEELAKKITESEKKDTGHSTLNDKLYAVAKYVAIGTLGLAVGGFTARHMSRAAEFAADKRAVAFTKDPKALIRALEKIHHKADEVLAAEGGINTSGIREWLAQKGHEFANATYRAHPELGERIGAIKDLAF